MIKILRPFLNKQVGGMAASSMVAILNRFERWTNLCNRVGANRGFHAVRGAYFDIDEKYQGHRRHFHTWEHIDDCLRVFDEHRDQFINPDAGELSLILHDVEIDSWMQYNEIRSSKFAFAFVTKVMGLDEKFARTVAGNIIATDHVANSSRVVGGFPVDHQLVRNIDLVSLAAPLAQFDMNTELVRREYWWLSDLDFHRGKVNFFRNLLSGGGYIYTTVDFVAKYSKQAKGNIQRYLRETENKYGAAALYRT